MKLIVFSFVVFLTVSFKPTPAPSLVIEIYQDETGKTILHKSYDNRVWDECSIAEKVGRALIEECKETKKIKKL